MLTNTNFFIPFWQRVSLIVDIFFHAEYKIFEFDHIIVHFKRLGSRVSYDSLKKYALFFSKNVHTAKQMRRFLNLFHEYRNVNGTL